MSTGQAAAEVLSRYPSAVAAESMVALGNRSGFSGASLWRVRAKAGEYCLRAWPSSGPSSARLQTIHRLMAGARAADVAFVPTVCRNREGQTWIDHAGRLWDLTAWMPGQSDFQARPGCARLEAACTALARLHVAWAEEGTGVVACPAILRRLECLRQWTALVRSGWRPQFDAHGMDAVGPWAAQSWKLLAKLVPRLADQLAPWTRLAVQAQPCLCDIWHDHVLFEGDEVSGVVDYGSVKMDHVAVDLARLLGSLIGDDRHLQAAGIEAYRRQRPFTVEEEALVKVLDETGTVLGAANWLRWLYYEGRQYEDRQAVARRLAALVERMQGWG